MTFTYKLTPAQIKVLHVGLIYLIDSEDHTDAESDIIRGLIVDFKADKAHNPIAFHDGKSK